MIANSACDAVLLSSGQIHILRPKMGEDERIMRTDQPVRVLYSFPHKLGGRQIDSIAWHHVVGLADAGAEVLVCPGAVQRALPLGIQVRPTLARGGFRIPYRLLGRVRALALHDWVVARRLEKMAGQIDIVHAWPIAALQTLRVAKRLGIPAVLERPNAHTRYAYEVTQRENERLGIVPPPGYSHTYNEEILRKEELEYELAHRLMCPSDFVLRTFLDEGFPREKLARHQYGFNAKTHYPDSRQRDPKRGLTVLFAGACTPRKGLHYALEAWLQSPASADGTFLVVWEYLPGYPEKLTSMLAHHSVKVLGFRKDLPDLMRQSDVLVLPSIEEGSALVTSEARACGCVLVVSEASGAYCMHMENALIHKVGDVDTLTRHFTLLNRDRALLERLRAASLSTVQEITWPAVGSKLLQVYRDILEGDRENRSVAKERQFDRQKEIVSQ
jgi:glycosyltransferase involved in cell wall biosynthesis